MTQLNVQEKSLIMFALGHATAAIAVDDKGVFDGEKAKPWSDLANKLMACDVFTEPQEGGQMSKNEKLQNQALAAILASNVAILACLGDAGKSEFCKLEPSITTVFDELEKAEREDDES